MILYWLTISIYMREKVIILILNKIIKKYFLINQIENIFIVLGHAFLYFLHMRVFFFYSELLTVRYMSTEDERVLKGLDGLLTSPYFFIS